MFVWIVSFFDSCDIVQFLFMLCSLQNHRIDLFESPPALGYRFFINYLFFINYYFIDYLSLPKIILVR